MSFFLCFLLFGTGTPQGSPNDFHEGKCCFLGEKDQFVHVSLGKTIRSSVRLSKSRIAPGPFDSATELLRVLENTWFPRKNGDSRNSVVTKNPRHWFSDCFTRLYCIRASLGKSRESGKWLAFHRRPSVRRRGKINTHNPVPPPETNQYISLLPDRVKEVLEAFDQWDEKDRAPRRFQELMFVLRVELSQLND